MATYKCNDGVYTVLRNGKVITMSGTSTTAIANIAADAINVVCPPECCITEVPITIDSFDIVVTTAEYTGLSIRATITHGVDTYSTSWEAAAATNTIDLTGLIVEFATFTDGDTICIEYSYSDRDAIQGCCLTVQVNTYLEDDTYQLSEIVTECEGGTFDLVFQNPDGGVTVDAAGEMVVPDLAEDETVYVTYTCDGCVTELLILTATNVVPVEGLRMVFNSIGNVPVVDASNVGQWNTFFDLPTNGAVFTSAVVAGNQVTLVGGGAMTLAANLFLADTSVIEIEDQTGIVVAGGAGVCNGTTAMTTLIFPEMLTAAASAFNNNPLVTTLTFPKLTTAGNGSFNSLASITALSFPELLTAGSLSYVSATLCTSLSFPLLTAAGDQSFADLTDVTSILFPELLTAGLAAFYNMNTNTSFSFPLLTTAGQQCFDSCLSATLINIPLCVNLGNDPTDASVFNLIVGQTITLNIAAVNATNNAGGVHASVAYLIANNTATVNYI